MLLVQRVVIQTHIEYFVSVLLHFDSVIFGIIPHFNIVIEDFVPGTRGLSPHSHYVVVFCTDLLS